MASTSPRPAPPGVWLDRAFARFENALGGDDALSERATAVLRRVAGANGASSVRQALTSAPATPFLALMDAYREDAGLAPDDPAMASIGEASLFEYCHVRAQDDLVDEPDLFDRGYAYAACVFASEAVRAYAAAGRGAALLLAFRARVMRRFASVAAFELDVVRRRSARPDEAERLGEKLLPMAVPLGAIACAAGRTADLDALPSIVAELGAGIQMVNDLLNAPQDHAAGRYTPVLAMAHASARLGAGDAASAVRAALFAPDVLDAVQDFATCAIRRAEDRARAVGAPRLADAIGRRAGFVREVPSRLLSLALGGRIAP